MFESIKNLYKGLTVDSEKLYPLIGSAGIMYGRIKEMQEFGDKRLMSYHSPTLIMAKNTTLEDIKRVVYAWINLHPVLKAQVVLQNGKPYYKPRDSWRPEIKCCQLKEEPNIEFWTKKYRPFPIPGDELFRVEVCTYNDITYIYMDIHHLALDGYSAWIGLRDIEKMKNGKIPIPEKISFFKNIENTLAKLENYDCQRKFFKNMYGDKDIFMYPTSESPISELPEYGKITGDIELPNMDDRCKALQISPYSVFLASYMKALSKNSGQKSFLVPTLSVGRKDKRLIRTFGCLYEIVPIPYEASEISFEEEVKELEETIKEIMSRDFIVEAFPEYIGKLGAVFNYMANFEQLNAMAQVELSDEFSNLRLPPPEHEFANALMLLEVYKPGDNRYYLEFYYNKMLYKEETAKMLVDTVLGILSEFEGGL